MEVVRGPDSDINIVSEERALHYTPKVGCDGGYEVRIYWKGKLIQDMPVLVGC